MITNTIYISKEDYPVTKEKKYTATFYHDKSTKNTERFTCLASDKVDKKNALQVTITISPMENKTNTPKKKPVRKKR